MPIPVVVELSRRWYGDRLDPGFEPRSEEEHQRFLREVGLMSEFWALS